MQASLLASKAEDLQRQAQQLQRRVTLISSTKTPGRQHPGSQPPSPHTDLGGKLRLWQPAPRLQAGRDPLRAEQPGAVGDSQQQLHSAPLITHHQMCDLLVLRSRADGWIKVEQEAGWQAGPPLMHKDYSKLGSCPAAAPRQTKPPAGQLPCQHKCPHLAVFPSLRAKAQAPQPPRR